MEIIAVCSQIHTKHIKTLCGQNVELLNVKLGVHMYHQFNIQQQGTSYTPTTHSYSSAGSIVLSVPLVTHSCLTLKHMTPEHKRSAMSCLVNLVP